VVPPGARDDVRLGSVSRSNGSLLFEISNQGTRHTLLDNLRILLSREEDGEAEVVLEGPALEGIAGQNMLAQTMRRFSVQKPSELWDGPLYARLEYSPKY
jgi:hypothetical protein